MGGSLTYDKDYAKTVQRRSKSDSERFMEFSKDFPNCKGLYPDCPAEPSLMNSMCRTCPKTDGMKKPKLEE